MSSKLTHCPILTIQFAEQVEPLEISMHIRNTT